MKKLLSLAVFLFISTIVLAQVNITSAEAKDHIGQIVSICDRVVDGKFLENAITKPTLLNVGGAYPNHIFTIVINFENRGNFSFKPEEYYLNKRVCITGKVADFKGKPQIVVLSPAEMIINEDETQPSPRNSSGVTTKPVSAPPVSNVSRPNVIKDTASSIKHIDPPIATTTSSLSSINKSTTPEPSKVNPVIAAPKTTATKINADTVNASKTNPAKSYEVYDIKLTADVNVRSGPANTTEVSEIIKAGTVVTILSSENGWSYVSYQRFSQEQLRPLTLKGYIKNSVLK